MAVDSKTRQDIIDVLDELGAAVDTDIEEVSEVDGNVTLPGIRVDSGGNFVSYVLARMTVFKNFAVQQWNQWFGTSTSTGVQGEWNTLKTDAQSATSSANTAASTANSAAQRAETAISTAAQDHTRAESDHSTASSDHSTAVSDHGYASTDHTTAGADHSTAVTDHGYATTDHTTAGTDHTQAVTDHNTASGDHTQAGQDHSQYTIDHQNVQGAENLNAQLSGYTVSITNRNGVTTSVDIGFEIYRTYTSVASMNADAANVPQGKFVVIATTDATDPDNAKMYCKNSQGSFTFLCDLDQASSAAWAEWLNTQKPLIEGATASANAAATNANDKAALANTKAQLADTKAQYAESEGDRAKGYNDHPWSIGNDGYIYVWDETTEQMVRTNRMIINFDDLTEEQKEEMAQAFYDTLVFATVAEGQRAIAELT